MRSRGAKATGGVWLTFFLGYWAWRWIGILGIVLLAVVFVALSLFLLHRDRAK